VAAPSRLLNVTVNVLFNRYLSDVYTGYKVFTRKAFEGLTLTAKTLPSRWNSPRTLFVTVAVFAALTLRNVIEWRLSRLAWVLGVGASVGVLQVVAYFTLLSVGDNPAMRRWWVAWYVPVSQGPGRAVAFVVTHTGQALTSLGPWAPGRWRLASSCSAWWRSPARACWGWRCRCRCSSCSRSWPPPGATRSWTRGPACSSRSC
jgi:hypothetical protein